MKMATKVVDYKLENGKRYYKVKWECSWELEDNLHYCQELVDQFWNFVDKVNSQDNRFPLRKKACLGLAPDADDTAEDDGKQLARKAPIEEENRMDFSRVDRGLPLYKVTNSSDKIVISQESESQKRRADDLNHENHLVVSFPETEGGKTIIGSSILNGRTKEAMNHKFPTVQCVSISPLNIASQKNTDTIIEESSVSKSERQSVVNVFQQRNPTLVSTHSVNVISNDLGKEDSLISDYPPSTLSGSNNDYNNLNNKYLNQNNDLELEQGTSDGEIDGIDIFREDEINEQDPNDIALNWKNPYVRISFKCRICNGEQTFSNTDDKWKKHFLTHVDGASKEMEKESSNLDPLPTEIAPAEEVTILMDPEKPWIQKVEYVIQKWGVNQYVRLAFLCRSCGKEQQPLHTGNWRNHYNSHKHNRPHPCQKCTKTFKSRSYLNQHLKNVHDKVEGIGLRSCFVCSQVFTRRLDLQRHIAEAHKINPNIVSRSMTAQKRIPLDDSLLPIKNNKSELFHPSSLPNEDRSSSMSLFTHAKIISDTLHKCEICSSNFTSQTELRKHKRNCPMPTDNELDKNNFKHVCGICQERFPKKINLKHHTVNVHCIDIGHTTSNKKTYSVLSDLRDPPTMVGLPHSDTGRSLNGHSSNTLVNDPTERSEMMHMYNNDDEDELVIVVKEEVPSDNEK